MKCDHDKHRSRALLLKESQIGGIDCVIYEGAQVTPGVRFLRTQLAKRYRIATINLLNLRARGRNF